MGSEYQSLLIAYICSLAFTGQSSHKTLWALAWNKSVHIMSERPWSV